MKTLLITLATFLLTSNAFSATAFNNNKPLPAGFQYVDTRSSEYQTYFNIRKKAIDLIRLAQKGHNGYKLDESASKLGEQVIQELLLASFAISTNSSSKEYCADNSAFVNSFYPRTIFICDPARDALQKKPSEKHIKMAAQMFIHEGAHLVDHKEANYKIKKYDECYPSLFELLVMEIDYGRKNIPSMGSRDAYRSQCEVLAEYDDVPSE